ncbi:MAG TPA: indolepyruvate ferredoxin oxidoreductase family protein, partial [Rhodospirillales bacterium]|nr:indolepyruvate ferredoxin oxidoreductase family protein [Rhodospirillales bacterium]
YKILFNDATAMTGGQPHDGILNVPLITRQVSAEGVGRIAVVSDQPDKYPSGSDFAKGVTFHHRRDLDTVQRQIRDHPGTSAIVYDQTCAAELRRRRKRGLAPDPQQRVFINEAVCEGCGDCGMVSNCVAIRPTETPYGRKRTIDQSSCNKDFSCVNGFCPSFVTVKGGKLRQAASQNLDNVPFPTLDDPTLPDFDKTYDIVVTGIGGTGVVTIGALLGMAAHIEGKGVSVLDQIGLAQKNGAVMSHVRIGKRPADIYAARIPAGGTSLLLGCDMVTAGGFDALSKLHPKHTHAVINSAQTMTAAFTQNPDLEFPERALMQTLQESTSESRFIDAGALATALMGDTIATNLFLVGFAWQKGLLPLAASSIEQAIDINGVATDFNKQAFLWGRRAAAEPEAVEKIADPDRSVKAESPDSLEHMIAARTADLTAYQNAAYGARYGKLIDRVRQAETKLGGKMTLTDATARAYYKLLAVKDEYEVARLYTDGSFSDSLNRQFEGDFRLQFHLAPPILSSIDPVTGRPRKMTFGPWMMTVFKVLAGLKGLRGTLVDPFRHSADRKFDGAQISQFESDIETLLADLSADNLDQAVAIAALPLTVRGYGPVRHEAAIEADRSKV